MQEKTKRDLRKLFKLLKARRPLWDKDDEHFYCAKTIGDLWCEVFHEMNLKDSEVKKLLLKLRELLRVKKPKRAKQWKAYFNKSSSDWQNVTYLKSVENLRCISSLDVDDDSDSISTVSTMTTDIDSDCESSAVDDPGVYDQAVGYSTVLDMAFGDLAVCDLSMDKSAILDVTVSNSTKVDPIEVDMPQGNLTHDFCGNDEWNHGESSNDEWISDDLAELNWSDSGSGCTHCGEADNKNYEQEQSSTNETPNKIFLFERMQE